MISDGKTRIRHPLGAPPGTLIPLGTGGSGPVRIDVLSFDGKESEEQIGIAVETAEKHLKDPRMTWVTVDGIHDPQVIREVGQAAGIHPIFLEDIMNAMIRPKLEVLDSQILVLMKTPVYDEQSKELVLRQVSLVVGPRYVITFLEQPTDLFSPLKKRITTPGSSISKKDADHLAYALMDILVDRYYTVLDTLESRTEDIEHEILDNSRESLSLDIHRIRGQLIILRKVLWPTREIVRSLLRDDITSPENRLYYSDIYDHVIQLMDHVDTLREIVSGLMDIYMSSISNRMNAVMKVLTIIATIFIPLTFIAGIYGMNFSHMPELDWAWGYFAVLGIMVLVVAGMLYFFRRKGWL